MVRTLFNTFTAINSLKCKISPNISLRSRAFNMEKRERLCEIVKYEQSTIYHFPVRFSKKLNTRKALSQREREGERT